MPRKSVLFSSILRPSCSGQGQPSMGERGGGASGSRDLIFQDGCLISGSLEALIEHLVPTVDYYPDVSAWIWRKVWAPEKAASGMVGRGADRDEWNSREGAGWASGESLPCALQVGGRWLWWHKKEIHEGLGQGPEFWAGSWVRKKRLAPESW